MSLQHAVAIVTGAGQGIGRDIALALAREGAHCALVARSADRLEETERLIADAGGRAVAVAADVSDEASVDRVFEETGRRLGPPGILVNNAGIAGPMAPIRETALDGWLETLAINLTGPWLTCRAAARVMSEHGGGRIINIGSISGKRPLANRSPYCASKMGLLGLTRSLAQELGPAGINVNCISPGPVKTARLELIAKGAGMTLDALLQHLQQGAPLGRIAEGSDIAALCVYLASDAARNITGQDFTVDGGLYMD
ncbi:MAG TPA: SDR family NAD(P)-dependent oxidoreductase [Pseudomonadales bacterium]